MHSTLNYIGPVQFERDWKEATTTIAAREFEVIEAGRGNDGSWKARKTMVLFSALPANLGNR